MAREDVLHSLLVQTESLVPELEAPAVPIPEGRNAAPAVVNENRSLTSEHVVRVEAVDTEV
ncbi:hypothetical protein GCM10010302_74750 [Streptomyces polychromogenes]|uniref:Uncharacterized protein n=1 Tax=Streptomyces polychromogenes TaxID=67342 RepID=A0ABP3FV55_9ACTN